MVSRETQWTQTGTRVQSQVDATHLVRITGTIMSIPIQTVLKAALGKAD